MDPNALLLKRTAEIAGAGPKIQHWTWPQAQISAEMGKTPGYCLLQSGVAGITCCPSAEGIDAAWHGVQRNSSIHCST